MAGLQGVDTPGLSPLQQWDKGLHGDAFCNPPGLGSRSYHNEIIQCSSPSLPPGTPNHTHVISHATETLNVIRGCKFRLRDAKFECHSLSVTSQPLSTPFPLSLFSSTQHKHIKKVRRKREKLKVSFSTRSRLFSDQNYI